MGVTFMAIKIILTVLAINCALSVITCIVEKPTYKVNIQMQTESLTGCLVHSVSAIVKILFYIIYILNFTFWKVTIARLKMYFGGYYE